MLISKDLIDGPRLGERAEVLPIRPRDLAICHSPIFPVEKQIPIPKPRLIPNFFPWLHNSENSLLHPVNRSHFLHRMWFCGQAQTLCLPLEIQPLSAPVSG